MKLACIAFTGSGMKIAERIKLSQEFVTDIFDKHSYKEQLENIFNSYKGILFIGSTGIAVRLNAPYLVHKTLDPAIVVVDDLGRFSISLVSGHLGGANDLAQRIAQILQCQPVITTASDARNIEAIDMFAKNNGLYIESMEAAKKLTAMMLEGKKIKLDTTQKLAFNYRVLSDHDYDGVLYVSSELNLTNDKPFCVLRPKNINIGIGCRRGKHRDEILKAIEEIFALNNISLNSIKTIASVDVKSDEEGIIEACKSLGCTMTIFTREEISKVQEKFAASDFVKSNIGVTSVCEPCAHLAGGDIIVSKAVMNGITIAVAKER
jgi:cobalt-precorrin 5A hydrolase